MTSSSSPDVTQLLLAWSDGDVSARDKLMPRVYEELRRLAHGFMTRERPDRTLQTTALVNEAYLRLVDVSIVEWESRAQFFGLCSQLMRRILVDFARSRQRLKRGGDAVRVSLDEGVVSRDEGEEMEALDDALNALAAVDSRKSQVVELRFFGGLSVEETAKVLKVTPRTVLRDWRLAKAWLSRELNRKAQEPHGNSVE